MWRQKTFELNSQEELTKLILQRGINTWEELLNYVRSLPYGRNKNRDDLSLVLIEGKGTCSSKHALLKKVAELNCVSGVQLIVGIYKMNQKNTPQIGTCLSKNGLTHIPEAHCYLNVGGTRLDLTSPQSNFKKIKGAILEERIIQAEDVSVVKVKWHQDYIKKWLVNQKVDFTFDEVWKIREECIAQLSAN